MFESHNDQDFFGVCDEDSHLWVGSDKRLSFRPIDESTQKPYH